MSGHLAKPVDVVALISALNLFLGVEHNGGI